MFARKALAAPVTTIMDSPSIQNLADFSARATVAFLPFRPDCALAVDCAVSDGGVRSPKSAAGSEISSVSAARTKYPVRHPAL